MVVLEATAFTFSLPSPVCVPTSMSSDCASCVCVRPCDFRVALTGSEAFDDRLDLVFERVLMANEK